QEFWAPGERENHDNGFVPGEWNHLMLTYDGEFIREYTGGRLINEWATAGLPIGEGEAMVIGGWNGGFGFIGEMDEVRIYDRALTLEALAQQAP
ncbi:LamG domain-containing protein, partial [Myxococcota bacterium]|nr:LamG domain-containing protein [Myxococcota bacterium]